MTTSQQGSAKIYQFPVGGRGQQKTIPARGFGSVLADGSNRTAPPIMPAGGWSHEIAVSEVVASEHPIKKN